MNELSFNMTTWVETRVKPSVCALLPKGSVQWPEFEVAMRAAVLKNDKLLPAITNNPGAALLSLIRCARLGLSLNPALEHFDLIPYKGIVEGQVRARGLMFLAQDSGEVDDMGWDVVYKQEGWDGSFNADGRPAHTPHPFDRDAYPDKDIIGAYAFAHVKGAPRYAVATLGRARLDKLQAMSKSPNSPAWVNEYPRMCCVKAMKSLLRTGMVPLQPRVQQALRDDDQHEVDPEAKVTPSQAPPRRVLPISPLRGFSDEGARQRFDDLTEEPFGDEQTQAEQAQNELGALMRQFGTTAQELDLVSRHLFKEAVEIQNMTKEQAEKASAYLRSHGQNPGEGQK